MPASAIHFDGFIRYVVTKPDKSAGGSRTQRGRFLAVTTDDGTYGSITDAQAETWAFGIEPDTLPTFPLKRSSGAFTTTAGDQIRFGRMCSCSAPGAISRIPQADLVNAALTGDSTSPVEVAVEPTSPKDEAEEKVAPAPLDLDAMLKPALLELAQSYDLDVDNSDLKATIRAAIDKHLGY